jgi:transcription antitermination protein NusB
MPAVLSKGSMLRPESRVRARAIQILYAWEVGGRLLLHTVAERLYSLHGGHDRDWERGEALAQAVVDHVDALDAEVERDLAQWRMERVGVNERNILRLAIHELIATDLPAPVVISEALRLARWFASAKAPPLINGVLDPVARRLGRL